MSKFAPTKHRPTIWCLALCLLGLVGAFTVGAAWAFAQQHDDVTRTILVVPYKEYVADLKPAERQRLEDALGGDITRMIDVGIVREGDMLDLAHPSVWFSYNFNKWIRLRTARQGTLDVREVEQWEVVERAFGELRRRVREIRR